jgi:TIR domain
VSFIRQACVAGRLIPPLDVIPKRDMLFVSHATPEDNEFSRWLALQLAKEGFPVWCDLTKLQGGEPFWKEIEDAIRLRTRRFLFVLSKNSNQKEGTLDELSVASTIRKQLKDDHFIIPLRIDDLPFGDININLHKLNASGPLLWLSGGARTSERTKACLIRPTTTARIVFRCSACRRQST